MHTERGVLVCDKQPSRGGLPGRAEQGSDHLREVKAVLTRLVMQLNPFPILALRFLLSNTASQ